MFRPPPRACRPHQAHLTGPHAGPRSPRRPSSTLPPSLLSSSELDRFPSHRAWLQALSVGSPFMEPSWIFCTHTDASQPPALTLGPVLCECRFQHPHSGYSESRSRSSVLGRDLEAPKASRAGRAARASICHSLGAGKFCLGLGPPYPGRRLRSPCAPSPAWFLVVNPCVGSWGALAPGGPHRRAYSPAAGISLGWALGWESFQTPGEPYTGEDYLAINGAGISTQAGRPQGCSNSESTPTPNPPTPSTRVSNSLHTEHFLCAGKHPLCASLDFTRRQPCRVQVLPHPFHR